MMRTELWNAKLNPSSPRYLDWRRIFDTDDIPLTSPFPFKTKLGDLPDLEMVYLLNWLEIDEPASDRLIDFVAVKFNVPHVEVEDQLNMDGVFPIRQADVLVSFSLRAFL